MGASGTGRFTRVAAVRRGLGVRRARAAARERMAESAEASLEERCFGAAAGFFFRG